MSKIFSKKGIILIIIPLFTLFLQGFIRFILKSDFNTIGITLGSLGIGQLLPFFYFDHFVANKLLGISPEYKFENVPNDFEAIITVDEWGLVVNYPELFVRTGGGTVR